MARWRLIPLLCLVVSVLLFVSTVVMNGTTPQFVLVQKIRRLQAQNKKLHENVHNMATEPKVGGTETITTNSRQTALEPDLYYSFKSKHCESIHVAMVVAGYNTSRAAVTLIKSILFYRHSPLNFHFISDQSARHTLRVLFKTWQLNAVNYTFYTIEDFQSNVSWIPNLHYSGVYGLMKLSLPSILPATLDKVAVLDVDTMLTADIAHLWAFFKVIERQRKLFGLVENQSDWYLGKLWEGHKPWPALGRGFNTGVMLLNLQVMRERGWYTMWESVAVRALQTYRSTALADQDIINAVIKDYPDTHAILPCAWNVQLSEHTLSDYCYRDAEEFKVIHWNSPQKLEVLNNHGPYFKSLYQSFQGFNGDLLRNELLSCETHKSHGQNKGDAQPPDPCFDFRGEAQVVHRTHPFYIGYEYLRAADDNDVTLVTQLSMDRLQILEPLCIHWEGPLSISLYLSDSETQYIMQYLQRSETLRRRINLALHIVYKDGSLYPVNYLRNVALDNVRTPYVFLSDADFLPMPDLYLYLREAIRVLGMSAKQRVLVVPAFETLRYKLDFPDNKAELLSLLAEGSVSTFRYQEWPQGHAPTNYDHWMTAELPYKVNWAPDFEPYIVVSRYVTRYDTRFVGFGWNKVSHVMELDAQGYEFVVLPDAFSIHMPHAPSQDIAGFRSNKRYRDCLQVLKREFQHELEAKYGQPAVNFISETVG